MSYLSVLPWNSERPEMFKAKCVCVFSCFPVPARHLLLPSGLCPLADGGLCGTGASAGDRLWLVCTATAICLTLTVPVLTDLLSLLTPLLIFCLRPPACSRSRTWAWRSLPWQQDPSSTTEDTWFWKSSSASASAVSIFCPFWDDSLSSSCSAL